jgi:hypothetical protein
VAARGREMTPEELAGAQQAAGTRARTELRRKCRYGRLDHMVTPDAIRCLECRSYVSSDATARSRTGRRPVSRLVVPAYLDRGAAR